MNVIAVPTEYGSAFRPACFSLGGVGAPEGLDVRIVAYGSDELLGTKRIYAAENASINVAPYLRGSLNPAPMCGNGAGVHLAPARHAGCYLSAPGGFISERAVVCGGTETARRNTLLSASPGAVGIAPGERDEMAVISGDRVVAVVTFRRGNVTYTDPSIGQRDADGMLAVVVDVDAVCRSYARLTGGAEGELGAFSVRLVLEENGFEDRVVERSYSIDRSGVSGRRLAWVNRFGAVDYHTFPVVEELRLRGSRAKMETPEGYRTVATVAERSLKLLSEPCDGEMAEWLSEIWSSPSVWMVEGAECERVEVASGELVCSPMGPSVVSVVVSPAAGNVSRKF